MLIFYDKQMILQVRSPHNIHFGISAVSPSDNIMIPLQPNHILLLLHSLAQSLPYPEIFPHDPSSLLYLRGMSGRLTCTCQFPLAPSLGGAGLLSSDGAPPGSQAPEWMSAVHSHLTAHLWTEHGAAEGRAAEGIWPLSV